MSTLKNIVLAKVFAKQESGEPSGAGLVRGSFTPATQADPNNFEIELGTECRNIVFFAQTSVLGLGYRAISGMMLVQDIGFLQSYGTNSGQTGQYTGADATGKFTFSGTKIMFSDINRSANGFGYFAAGIKYQWVAW